MLNIWKLPLVLLAQLLCNAFALLRPDHLVETEIFKHKKFLFGRRDLDICHDF